MPFAPATTAGQRSREQLRVDELFDAVAVLVEDRAHRDVEPCAAVRAERVRGGCQEHVRVGDAPDPSALPERGLRCRAELGLQVVRLEP